MYEAMMSAEVGDDVYGTDPTVNHFQREIAKFFGKEDALFVTSGTQGNLIALMSHVMHKGDAAIIGNKCHINKYERGGISAIGNILPIVLNN